MDVEALQPDFSVIINDETELIKERVISIHTTDEAGIMSDSCEIELDDFDDAFPIPRTEAVISVSLGYKGGELTKIGSYYVKEIDIDGARKTIKIKANAAGKAMRSQKSKSHEGGLSELIPEMAGEFGLDSAISDDVAEDLQLEDFPQFAESDMNYLTRISQKVGAVAKPTDGHLVFADDMSAKSTSGKNLPTKYVDVSELGEYSCSFKETENSGAVGTVFANWYDKENGEYHMVKSGSNDPEIELDEIFTSEKSALAAANAKFKRVVKSNKTFRFTTGGRPDFFAESPIVFTGLSQKIPINWIISRVEHTLNASGFVTSVECSSLV
jgi:phage protein D